MMYFATKFPLPVSILIYKKTGKCLSLSLRISPYIPTLNNLQYMTVNYVHFKIFWVSNMRIYLLGLNKLNFLPENWRQNIILCLIPNNWFIFFNVQLCDSTSAHKESCPNGGGQLSYLTLKSDEPAASKMLLGCQSRLKDKWQKFEWPQGLCVYCLGGNITWVPFTSAPTKG